MNPFADWIRAVLLVTFLVTLVRLLLPEGGLRPFVRLVTGFVVLAVILQPVLAFLGGEADGYGALDGLLPESASSAAAWIAVGEEIARRGAARAAEQAGQSMADRIEALVMLVPGVEAVAVESVEWSDAGIRRVTLRLAGAPSADRRVRELVAKYFGLDEAVIVTLWNPREGD